MSRVSLWYVFDLGAIMIVLLIAALIEDWWKARKRK